MRRVAGREFHCLIYPRPIKQHATCLFVCLLGCLFVCLFVCWGVCLFVCLLSGYRGRPVVPVHAREAKKFRKLPLQIQAC